MYAASQKRHVCLRDVYGERRGGEDLRHFSVCMYAVMEETVETED